MPLDLDSGQVTIFRNDKGDNPKRPDYKGELKTPDGTHLNVSLWVREAKKSGMKFLSGQVDAPQEQTNGSQKSGDDDLPF